MMLQAGQLRIRVAIARSDGAVRACAMAVLTPLDEPVEGQTATCHTTEELRVYLPPGDTGVQVGDGVRFGNNRFVVAAIAEGSRRDLACLREREVA